MGFQMGKWTSELDLEEMVQFLTGPNWNQHFRPVTEMGLVFFYGTTQHTTTQRPLRGVLRDPSGHLSLLYGSPQELHQGSQSWNLVGSSGKDTPQLKPMGPLELQRWQMEREMEGPLLSKKTQVFLVSRGSSNPWATHPLRTSQNHLKPGRMVLSTQVFRPTSKSEVLLKLCWNPSNGFSQSLKPIVPEGFSGTGP